MCNPFSFAGPQPKQAMLGAYVSWRLFSIVSNVQRPTSNVQRPMSTGNLGHWTLDIGDWTFQLFTQLESLYLSCSRVRQIRDEDITARAFESRQRLFAELL